MFSAGPLYITAAFLQWQVSVLAFDPTVPIWKPVSLHVACVALLAGWVWILRKYRMDGQGALLLLVSTAALGPIGFVGAVFSLALRQVSGRISARKLDEYYAWMAGETKVDAAAELYKDLTLGREQPGRDMANATIIDLLRWGTLDEKYKMIAALGRNFRPELVPALRFALASEDPTIRIQAAALVAKVEKDFTQRWLALRSEIENDPTQPERYFALARHLDEYAYAGIVDSLRERDIREQATELFRAYLTLNDTNKDARLFLGRLLTRLGEHAEALACLEPFLDDERALAWYYQSLYGLGRFDQLRELLQERGSRGDGPQTKKITGAKQLWTRGVAPRLLSPRASS